MKQRTTSDSPRLHCGSVSSAGTFPSSETVEGCALTSRNSTATWLHIACGTPGGRRLMAKWELEKVKNLYVRGNTWWWRKVIRGTEYNETTGIEAHGKAERDLAEDVMRQAINK